VVWEAYLRVKANKGAAGVDEVTIEQHEQNLKKQHVQIQNLMKQHVQIVESHVDDVRDRAERLGTSVSPNTSPRLPPGPPG
jgi:hypothetical protein